MTSEPFANIPEIVSRMRLLQIAEHIIKTKANDF